MQASIRPVTERQLARSLGAEERRDLQQKLHEVSEGLVALRIVLEGIQALLTPCDGEKDGEVCLLPDRHRGPHLSDAGTEWVDDD